MTTIWHDIRYGVRMLVKNPGFSLIVVALVAIGVGANTAMFSILNPLFMRPLSYPDADRIVRVEGRNQEGRALQVSYPDYLDWQRQATGFEALSCYLFRNRAVSTVGDEPLEECCVGFVSGDFFRVFSVQPAVGRFFLSSDDSPSAAPVAILSHSFWRRQFAADPDALGRTLSIDGSQYTIVGVTPVAFRFLPYGEPSGDVWVAAGRTMAQQGRESRSLSVVGRLKAGVSVTLIRGEMYTICDRLAGMYPSTNVDVSAAVIRLPDYMKGLIGRTFRQGASVLMGAVLMVLLVACTNATGLMFARAVTRERETALRLALGGTRLRLIRLTLSENLVLTLLGGGLGVIGSIWAIRLLLAAGLLPSRLFPPGFFRPDWRVLGLALGLSILGAPACGLIPSIYCSNIRPTGTLAVGARGVLGSRGRETTYGGLLAAQVALTIILLVAAGLLMRSLVNVVTADRGFHSEGILVLDVRLAGERYASAEANATFHRRLLSRLGSLPGVEKVGLTWPLLTGWSWRVYAEGQPVPPPGTDGTAATYKAVSPGYFETMGIPLLRGRSFDERDGIGSQRVVIVDETLARQCWPEGDWIGRRVKTDRGTDPNSLWAEVVGVVGHVQNNMEADSDVQVYKPILQEVRAGASVVLRTKGDPRNLIGVVKEAVRQIDRRQLASHARTLDEELWYDALVHRLATSLLGAFAGIALFLSSIGIYGATRHSVSRRTQEFGIRRALGAQEGDVLWAVFRRSLPPVLVGSALGLTGMVVVGHVLSGLLYGLSPWDPATYGAVSLLLMIVTLLASYLPARRAAKIDPMEALRYE